MPKFYRKKTRFRRRAYNKKKRMYRQAKRSFWGGYKNKPVGNRLKVNTRYVEKDVSVNGGLAGLAGVYVFSANGLYDPNITGAGHQPIGFDQYMQFYDHYTVIGAKIRVDFSNDVETANDIIVGITVMDSPTALTDPREYIENGSTRWRSLPLKTGGNSIQTLTQNVSVKKYLGRPKVLSEDNLRGSVSSNPNEQVYFHVWAAGFASVDPSATSFLAQIDYTAILTEPKSLSLS